MTTEIADGKAPSLASLTDPAPQDRAAADAQSWPARGLAWYVVGVLAIVLMISQLDRGVITLLVQPIKRDLQLSDTQMGSLMGLAFIVLYVVLGVPLARISDRRSRRMMIAGGVTFWSLCTVACGMAQSYVQLFVARVGIGAGEAVNAPATYSLLADYFPRERLPRALAVLNLGFIGGMGCSLILGSLVVAALPSLPEIHVPWLGTVHNWQLVFFAVGLPGLLIAAMMFTVPEPIRRGRIIVPGAKAPPFPAVLANLWDNRAYYGPMFLSLCIGSLATAGNQSWAPTFFQRSFGWSIPQAGSTIGILALVAGPAGLFFGTWLVEHFNRRGRDDANLRVVAIGYTVAIPFSVAGPLLPNPWLSLACIGIGSFFGMMGSPSATAALQTVTPNQMRGQTSSLYLLMLSAIGMGLGPMLVASLTDYVFRSEAMLRFSMSSTSAVLGPIAALLVWRGLRPYGEKIASLRRSGE